MKTTLVVLDKSVCLCGSLTARYSVVDMDEEIVALKVLYPDLSPEELVLAKENLDRYLSLAWEIYEDSLLVAQREPAPPSPKDHPAVISMERSIPNKPNHLQISETVSRVHQSLDCSPRRAGRILAGTKRSDRALCRSIRSRDLPMVRRTRDSSQAWPSHLEPDAQTAEDRKSDRCCNPQDRP